MFRRDSHEARPHLLLVPRPRTLVVPLLGAALVLAAAFFPGSARAESGDEELSAGAMRGASIDPGDPSEAWTDHLVLLQYELDRQTFRLERPELRADALEALGQLAEYLSALEGPLGQVAEGKKREALDAERLDLLHRTRERIRFPDGTKIGGEGALIIPATPGASGSLSGRVTHDDGTPYANMQVNLIRFGGSFADSTQTDSNGDYQFVSVEAGAYYAMSNVPNGSPYLDTIYPSELCATVYFECAFGGADILMVEAGVELDGIDMVLREGGSVSGRVRSVGDGTPVHGALVRMYDPLDGYADATTATDASGRYRIDRLLEETYRIHAYDNDFRNEAWDGHPCDADCTSTDGDLLAVELGMERTQIDFDVEVLGAIEGTARDALTDALVFPLFISVFDSAGVGLTDPIVLESVGSFRVAGLDTGTYYLRATTYSHIDQIWQGVSCAPSCDPTAGTPIEVVAGETTGDIHFQLDPYGEISGRVRSADDGSPLQAKIDLHDEAGTFISSSYSSSNDGLYVFLQTRPGSYRVTVSEADGHRLEAWDDIPCPAAGCAPGIGDLVTAVSGQPTTGIDFSLEALGSISGSVMDAQTAGPASPVPVGVANTSGEYIITGLTDSEGNFFFDNLHPGTYYVGTQSVDYNDEVWDNVPCEGLGCDPTTGTGIVLALGTETTGIDFVLDRRPWISGVITSEASGLPIENAVVIVYDAAGDFVSSRSAAPDGSYAFTGLTATNHYVFAYSSGDDEHIAMLYDGVACYPGLPQGCSALDGDPVMPSTAGATADIALPTGGSLSGRVSRQGGGEIPGGSVWLFDQTGDFLGLRSLPEDGWYRFEGLETGNYFVLTDLYANYANEVFDDTVCDDRVAPCSPISGTPVAVVRGAETTQIDFAVRELGVISGNLRNAADQASLPGRIELYDAGGVWVETVDSGNGAFVFDLLAPGTYYLRSSDNDGYRDRVYGGDICEPGPCDPTSGTPLLVQFDSRIGPLDLELDPGPGLDIMVLAEAGATPVAGCAIDVWDGSGDFVDTFAADASGRIVAPLPAGTYYVSTDNGLGLLDEVWQDVLCPDGPAFGGNCDPLLGTALVSSEGQDLQSLIFELSGSLELFVDGFESGSTTAWSESVGLVP